MTQFLEGPTPTHPPFNKGVGGGSNYAYGFFSLYGTVKPASPEHPLPQVIALVAVFLTLADQLQTQFGCEILF